MVNEPGNTTDVAFNSLLRSSFMVSAQQAIGWANAIRAYTPPVINGTYYCPGGTIINPYINASGLYQCGPCLIYIYQNATARLSCPR